MIVEKFKKIIIKDLLENSSDDFNIYCPIHGLGNIVNIYKENNKDIYMVVYESDGLIHYHEREEMENLLESSLSFTLLDTKLDLNYQISFKASIENIIMTIKEEFSSKFGISVRVTRIKYGRSKTTESLLNNSKYFEAGKYTYYNIIQWICWYFGIDLEILIENGVDLYISGKIYEIEDNDSRPKKKLTVAEIEEELGYRVEIISED